MKNNVLKRAFAICLTGMVITVLPSTALKASAAYENTHINTGNQREDIVAVAKTQIGYHEGANNETKYNHWLGAISGYPAGGYGYAWCHAFVSWCANQAGISSDIAPRTAGTYVGKNFFVNDDASRWEVSAAYDGDYLPQKGDFIYFGSGSSPCHVGIVSDCDGNYVYTIEGNHSDQVMSCEYNLYDSYVIGYGVPDYSGSDLSAPSVYTRHKYFAPNADIDIFWDRVEGATGYVIDIWRDGSHIISRDLGNVNVFTDTFTGENYTVYVTAYNSTAFAQSEGWSFFLKSMTTPVVRTNHKYYAPNSDIDIMWNKVEGANGYIIDIWREGKHIISKDLGDVNMFTDTFTGKEYGVFITAYNNIGGYTSATSEACSFYLKEMSAPVITAQFENSIQNSNVTLSWNEIEGAVGYILDIWRDNEHIISKDLGKQTSFMDVFQGKKYAVYVTAYNNIGGNTSAQSEAYHFTLYEPGDANLDHSIDVSDAVLIARFCAEESEAVITDQGRIAADVNHDGTITLDDTIVILRKIARIK